MRRRSIATRYDSSPGGMFFSSGTPHCDFENAHPQLPRPESSSAKVKQRRNLGDGGYTLASDRREMVTVAMRNGFAWAQQWELETSGPFALRRRDFRNGSWGVTSNLAILRLLLRALQRHANLSIRERFNGKPVGLAKSPAGTLFSR
jgi:hypothetical protein